MSGTKSQREADHALVKEARRFGHDISDVMSTRRNMRHYLKHEITKKLLHRALLDTDRDRIEHLLVTCRFGVEYGMFAVRDLKRLTNLSTRQINGLVKRQEFPQPVFMGPRTRRWSARDVMAWISHNTDFTVPCVSGIPEGVFRNFPKTDTNATHEPIKLNWSKRIRYDRKVGIYRLYLNDEIVYIGKSINIDARIANHTKDKKFDGFDWADVEEQFLTTIETMLIHKHKPVLNRDKNGNLHPRLPGRL